MKRPQLNALIDVLAFVAFLCLLSTGLVLDYLLPPGSGGSSGHGSGPSASERPVQLLWGWTRHEWGQVHYGIALVLLLILAIHVLLHWRWVVCTLRGKPSQASGFRLALGCTGLVFAILLSAAPLLSSPKTVTRSELRESRSLPAEKERATTDHQSNRHANELPELRGSMTLRQIAEACHLPVEELVAALQLPANTDVDENAGRLLRRHNLQMSDLRDWLARRLANNPTSPPR